MGNELQRNQAELMQRVAAGDKRAFSHVYDLYADRVYGLVLSILKDESSAEEVSQEVFVKVWSSAGTFRPDRGKVSSWLLTIARRAAIDRLRKGDRRPQVAPGIEVEADWDPRMGEPLSDSEEARWRTLYFALQELPVEQRKAIVLSYYHGLSHSEIAAQLDIPLGTAKTRIRLGMEKLREAWFGSSERSDSG